MMLILGTLIALAAALVFAALGVLVVNGIQHTIRTRLRARMRIMQLSRMQQIGSIVYVIVVASLPATLAWLTAWQIFHVVSALWSA
jgi:hypothetical protein